ncbi:MAG: 16S rRNA (guanine(527)-N(7))-methyltransferase RsmG, partial [Geobacteraceae bacterium]|nr:16S rRNA (guanine(527)-N(7))-methyltransferase RsmG [Geobacteraceae bacterium]
MSRVADCLITGAEQLGIGLTPGQIAQFETFAVELCKWNRKLNLTSITNPEEIAVKHFVDSLSVAAYREIRGEILDIGSGGGFPCLPLKIVFPEVVVVSVDAVAKKIRFQNHVARLIGLKQFAALHCRAESLGLEYGGRFDSIISRAFSGIPEFVRLALPLLADGGSIIAMKGREGEREALAAEESGQKRADAGEVLATKLTQCPVAQHRERRQKDEFGQQVPASGV